MSMLLLNILASIVAQSSGQIQTFEPLKDADANPSFCTGMKDGERYFAWELGQEYAYVRYGTELRKIRAPDQNRLSDFDQTKWIGPSGMVTFHRTKDDDEFTGEETDSYLVYYVWMLGQFGDSRGDLEMEISCGY